MAAQTNGGNTARAPAAKAPRVYLYRCTEPCTFLKRYHGAGDIVELPEKRDIPHFELAE